MSSASSVTSVASTTVGAANPANWVMQPSGSVFLATPVAVLDGEAQGFLIDAYGRQVVVGGVADGDPNPLAPIGIGGQYNAALPTYTDGDQVTDQHDIGGRKIVTDDQLLIAFNAEDFASEATLDALRTDFNAEDFASETTLDALRTDFNDEDFASETTLALIAANTLIGIVDEIDAAKGPLMDLSTNNIPASASLPLELVAVTAADIKKVISVEDIGEFFGLYTGAASSEVFECLLPLGGGEVELDIAAGTRLSIRHMKNSAVTSGFFALNCLG